MTTARPTDTEANRQIVPDAFEAWHHGTEVIADVFAETWSGASKDTRRRRGSTTKQQFINEVLAPFAARFTTFDPFRPITIRSVHADGDTVIVVWDGRGIATDGQPYENSYAWIMKMRDGQVVDGTAFYDSISFNDLWTRVQPQT